MLLCGKGYHIDDLPTLPSLDNAWVARLAVPFSIELAATGTLYKRLKVFTDQLIADAYASSKDFREISAAWIYQNPQFLPVFMHVAGAFSKQELKKQIGSATDKSISKPASVKIAALLQRASEGGVPEPTRIKERIRATVEGIVRDLVGRLLLEQFVASALARHGVPFKREEEYKNLEGVVYDFRSDFVVPNENQPLAFLEVRKSSSRHASLYAKDKMFSAINWKGRHQKCLAVLIIDGPWTEVTLKIMSRVFDYVIPINQVDEVAMKIRAYLDGDVSILQWLVNFNIMRFRADGTLVPAEKVQVKPEDLLDSDE
jgi:predicted Rdx family selenoprotein